MLGWAGGDTRPSRSVELRFLYQLFGLGADEGIVQCRQRIEFRHVAVVFLRFCVVTLSFVGLAQAVKVTRILQVGLFEFCDGFSVVLLSKRNSSSQFVGLFYLRRIL